MNNARRLEQLLAALLRYGTWLASVAIGLGSTLALIDSRFGTHNLALLPNMRIATAGIAMFILLPVLRVLLMLVMFILEGEIRFAIAAAVVLAIILLGFIVGFRATAGGPKQQRPGNAVLPVEGVPQPGIVAADSALVANELVRRRVMTPPWELSFTKRALQTRTTSFPIASLASITRWASRMSSKRNTLDGFAL